MNAQQHTGRGRCLPSSWDDANDLLGKRDTRKVANNTYVERRPHDAIAVRLHSTDVVTFLPSGTAQLDTGGWNTLTTRGRINAALGYGAGYGASPLSDWSVGTERGTLYLYYGHRYRPEEHKRYAWHPGVMVRPDGTTDAQPKPRRNVGSHLHPANCRCIVHRYATRTIGVQGEATITPEETIADAERPDEVTEERWSDYNRKFNELLCRGRA